MVIPNCFIPCHTPTICSIPFAFLTVPLTDIGKIITLINIAGTAGKKYSIANCFFKIFYILSPPFPSMLKSYNFLCLSLPHSKFELKAPYISLQ